MFVYVVISGKMSLFLFSRLCPEDLKTFFNATPVDKKDSSTKSSQKERGGS